MQQITKQRRFVLHGSWEARKVGDLSAKDEVSELCEGKEDDEEHDGESSEIFGTSAERRWQLRHGLVETDVLKDLRVRAHADDDNDDDRRWLRHEVRYARNGLHNTNACGGRGFLVREGSNIQGYCVPDHGHRPR